MTFIEYRRDKDDDRSPQRITIHVSYVKDFIFKIIDLERELEDTYKSTGFLLESITELCGKDLLKQIVGNHLEKMENYLKNDN